MDQTFVSGEEIGNKDDLESFVKIIRGTIVNKLVKISSKILRLPH